MNDDPYRAGVYGVTYCCPSCFEDDVIKDFVSSHSVRRGTCKFCRSTKMPLAETKTVAEFLRQGIRRKYSSIGQEGLPYELAEFDSIADILEHEGAFSDRHSDPSLLSKALMHDMAPSWKEISDGAIDETESGFVSADFWSDASQNHYQGAWDWFKAEIKHRNRFFDPPGISKHGPELLRRWPISRQEMLSPLIDLLPDLEIILPVNTSLWRGRVHPGKLPRRLHDRYAELGPPPVERATGLRMNPSGIPYLYVGSNADTCLAEVRPDVGDTIWLAQFKVLNPLRVVDLTKVPAFQPKSIFDPEYDHDRQWAGEFMQEFSREISKPVKQSESHIEYVPTQVLAEAVKHQGYHGIKFASSQHPAGWNLVLFDGPTPDECGHLPLCKTYHHWLRLAEVTETLVTGLAYQYSIGKKRRLPRRKEKPEDRPEF